MQLGLARYMATPQPYLELADFYQKKRDKFRAGLENSRFKLLPTHGTYFQCVDYSAISQKSESEFAQWLTREIGPDATRARHTFPQCSCGTRMVGIVLTPHQSLVDIHAR